jgi:transcriptional regulator with XRE-family HTH domain
MSDLQLVPPSSAPVQAATGRTVAANLAHFRKLRGLTYEQLAAILSDRNHSISALALSRVERLQRRVDVDDLVALADALNLSPLALLRQTRPVPPDVIEQCIASLKTDYGVTINASTAEWTWEE